MKRVLLLGGTGNFGTHIARRLAPDPNIRLLIGGRSKAKARAAAAALGATNAAEGHEMDAAGDLAGAFAAARPDLVIHTVGPFQHQSYRVAEAAIAAGAHYLDLADARGFVAGIGALDAAAKKAGVAVISGASSVPCLTAAIIERYRPRFARLETAEYGISTAARGISGLATAAAILSYVGRPIRHWRGGAWRVTHGWQGLRAETYPELGRRLFGDCEIPDLDLFPGRYPGLETVRFGAGHEVALLHLCIWALSWPVRARLFPRLDRIARPLLALSRLFDPLGTGRSGLHMILSGTDAAGAAKTIRFYLIARRDHGPYVPCIPAILLATRFAAGETFAPGARPCLDLVTLDQYLAGLAGLDISTVVVGEDA
jgi:hypothetical protein